MSFQWANLLTRGSPSPNLFDLAGRALGQIAVPAFVITSLLSHIGAIRT